jgi:phosphinothricin acetyltransferase
MMKRRAGRRRRARAVSEEALKGSSDVDVRVRAARTSDLEPLTRLYNHYVEHSPATFDIDPVDLETRREWMSHYRDHGPHRLLVAVGADRLLGYATSSVFRTRAAYATSVETSVYLDPEATGRGVGTRLYRELFGILEGQGLHRAYAGVTLPNPASEALHRRMGFSEAGLFGEVGRKFDRYWDVRWFEKQLGAAAEEAR